MRSEFKSATQIYVNPIYLEIQLILRNWSFFCIRGPDDQNWWKRKNCPKFFHRVIFAFWIQIFNPNLCKSHIFWITDNIEMWSFFATQIYVSPIYIWITANIEKWSFFAYADLMTKIDEIGKIARNSFMG